MSQPEMKIEQDGTKMWYLNGELHREDGPAIEYPDGTKHWFLNGEYHCEDGPAVESADGEKRWYLNGKSVSWKQVFKNAKTKEQELNIIIHALG